MALESQVFVNGAWVSGAARFENTSGAPLQSVADGATGEAISDTYTLTLSAVAGGTATVTVGTASPNNPYKARQAANVALDGATAYRNIIPGLILIFAAGGASGNVATVYIGSYAGTFDAFGLSAGVPGAQIRHRVVNSGPSIASSAQALLRTHAVLFKKIGSALASIKPFADGATEKEAGGGSTRTDPYHLVISGSAGVGPAKTVNLSVDGVLVPAGQLLDMNNSGAAVSGTGLKAVAGQVYQFAAPHLLQGLTFSIDPACADGDTANVLIFQARHIQIAPETGGVPGAWGVTPVVLTQAGQAPGQIQPLGEAFYYSRVNVPAGASAEKNPEPGNISLTATETGPAGWGL